MIQRKWTAGAVVLMAAGLGALGLSPAPAAQNGAGVRIGLVKTLFRDVPAALVPIGLRPMKELMVGQTGVNGDLVPCGDADSLAHDLKTDDVQLAVFHGVEFAWVHQTYPTIKPLVIAVNERPFLRADLVVRADGPVAGPADLKGKTVNLVRNQNHCRLFLERRLRPADAAADGYFGKEEVEWCVDDALDNVVDDTAQAAVVDEISLQEYGKSKPGCAAKLKVIERSEAFPCGVVAYQPGGVDAGTLAAFRDGLIAAKDNPRARKLLQANHLTRFESVPADYEQMFSDIAKAYPAAK